MGNLFGGLASGLGGIFGQGQAQQFGQQQFTGCTFTTDSSTAGSVTTSPYSFTISADAYNVFAPQPQIASGPETALAWLDRRVEEIRVKL